MELTRFNAAKAAIIAAGSFTELKGIRDKAEAARAYCKAAGESFEMTQRCAEIKVRAERRAGEMISKLPKAKRHVNSDTLSQLGIERHQSSRWQRLAAVPEKDFEGFLQDAITSRVELTTAAALRLEKSLRNGLRNGAVVESAGDTGGVLKSLADAGRQFATIYADPAWQYGNQATRAATSNHYPTMTVSDISAMPVKEIAAERSLLFLWTTNGFLQDALTQVIPAWGFEFKSCMVWVKPQMGIGNYVRVSHEFLLIANRGGLRPNGSSQMSWVQAPRERHSRKPNVFREIVERIAPAPRIELFAREQFNGWHAWGNEVERGLFAS